MKRNKKRVLIALLAISALAAGGAAFTASITGVPASSTNGFAQQQITGAAATYVHYNMTTDNQSITSVDLQFSTPNLAALTADTIKAGFGTTATNASLITCGTPAADATTPADTDVTCDFSGSPVAVTGANYFDVSVTG
jgi:hypothetical protein